MPPGYGTMSTNPGQLEPMVIARLDMYNTFTDPACMSPGSLKEP